MIGRKWPYDPKRESRIKDSKTTFFTGLSDLSDSAISKTLSTIVQSTFGVGDVVIIKTEKDSIMLGDFTLMFAKDTTLQNQVLTESFVDIVGAALARIAAEKSLKVQKEELFDFFSVNLDLLCIADVEGNFIKVNKEWEAVLGYTVKELESRKFLDFVHPDDMQSTLDVMKELENQKQVLNFTNRYVCKDGSYRYIEWRSKPKGAVIYAAARDVTENVKREEDIRDSEARKSSLIASMDDSIFVLDKNFVFIEYHQSQKEKLFIAASNFLHKSFDDIHFPEPAYSIIRSKLVECLENQKSQQVEYYLDFPSGIMWFDMRITPFDDSLCSVVGLTCVSRDITERKQNEAKMHKLTVALNQSPVTIVITDKEGNITYANPAFTEKTGYAIDEVLGKNPRVLKSDLLPQDVYEDLWKTISVGKEWKGEFYNKKKKGKFIWE